MRTITPEEHFLSKRFIESAGFNLGGQRATPSGRRLGGGTRRPDFTCCG
jgi:hypothetical protein